MIARWPEMMVKRVAAEYTGLSVDAFEREYLAGRLPSPVMFGGRQHWRKSAIDKALDQITGEAIEAEEPEYVRELVNKLAARRG